MNTSESSSLPVFDTHALFPHYMSYLTHRMNSAHIYNKSFAYQQFNCLKYLKGFVFDRLQTYS